MKPLDYLKHFVTVSGPRKHLYNLVFQRYRTMENPTKDWIWVKVKEIYAQKRFYSKFLLCARKSVINNLYLSHLDLATSPVRNLGETIS